MALHRELFNFVVSAISTMDKMLWEHILERKNVSILIHKDPFRLALRVLKIFELIQKSRRGQPRKNVPLILKYVTLHRILMLKVKARARHAFTLKQKNLF